MAALFFFNGKADQIYSTGPEAMVARSWSVLAGRLSRYSRQIVSSSEPPGPDAIPLKWIVTGTVVDPVALKGAATGPVAISRPEQSPILPNPGNVEDWEQAYGDLQDGGTVVVFLGGDSAHPAVIKAIPSGSGERDLATLVKDIVSIQSEADKQLRIAAWVAYFDRARLDEGRKAALRSLLNERADWQTVASALERVNSSLKEPMRTYAFGFVAFGITEGYWTAQQAAAVDFLCRWFESEGSPNVLLQDIMTLKLVLRYTAEEGARAARERLRIRVVDSLRRMESRASANPELAEQYRQIRAAYPGLL